MHDAPRTPAGQFNFPWMILFRLLRSPHRTKNVSEAEVFVVPTWARNGCVCCIDRVYIPHTFVLECEPHFVSHTVSHIVSHIVSHTVSHFIARCIAHCSAHCSRAAVSASGPWYYRMDSRPVSAAGRVVAPCHVYVRARVRSQHL